MSHAPRRWAAELLHAWFHELRPRDWWRQSDGVDAMLRRRFGPDLAMLALQPASSFLQSPQMALAAVLLFDQIPRNLHRKSAQAYAYDPLAREVANGALARGYDRVLPGSRAQFLAMPLMHSEDMADQRRSLLAFRRINRGSNLAFARSHHRMIARFGRFPHRNPVLGRESTSAERRAVEAGFAW